MIKFFIVTTAALFFLNACGSYQSGDNTQLDLGSGDINGGGPSIPTDPKDPSTPPTTDKGPKIPDGVPTNYSYSAKAEELAIFGLGQEKEVISFDIETSIIKVSVPFPILSPLIVSGSVPNHPDVVFYTDRESESLVFEIPLDKYLNLANDPNTLPDGRPLPGVTGGEPPRFGFKIPNSNLEAYAYVGNEYIAVFVESGLKLPFKMVANIKNAEENAIVGLLGWLPAEKGYRGGVFTSIKFPRELILLIANSQ